MVLYLSTLSYIIDHTEKCWTLIYSSESLGPLDYQYKCMIWYLLKTKVLHDTSILLRISLSYWIPVSKKVSFNSWVVNVKIVLVSQNEMRQSRWSCLTTNFWIIRQNVQRKLKLVGCSTKNPSFFKLSNESLTVFIKPVTIWAVKTWLLPSLNPTIPRQLAC